MSSYIAPLLLLAACTLASAGTTYDTTFTFYGSGDSRGDGTCNTNTAACGFYTNVCLHAMRLSLQQRPLTTLHVHDMDLLFTARLLRRRLPKPLRRRSWRRLRPHLRHMLAPERDHQPVQRPLHRDLDRGQSQQPLSRLRQSALWTIRPERDQREPIRRRGGFQPVRGRRRERGAVWRFGDGIGDGHGGGGGLCGVEWDGDESGLRVGVQWEWEWEYGPGRYGTRR